MTTELRQLEATDAEAFSALRRVVVADNPVPMGLSLAEELTRPIEGFRAQLAALAPSAVFGMWADGELRACAAVAWGRFASSGHKAELWGCLVHPAWRRTGLGRQVVGRALAHARANGARRVNLQVYLPNAAAVGLYQSLGFVAYGLEAEAVCLDGCFYDGQWMALRV